MNAPRKGYAGPPWVNVYKTPPIPVGGYQTDGERLGVPEVVAPAYAAALAAHAAGLSPCSNTGRTLGAAGAPLHAPAFVDYLSVTLKGLRRALTRVRRERPAPDGLDDLRAVLFDIADGGWDVTRAERVQSVRVLEMIKPDCTGCLSMDQVTGKRLDRGLAVIARTMLQSVAPALVFGELTGRGVNGYTDHLKIYTHLGERCGHIAVGGNAETVHIDLTGQACQRVNMPALADALDTMDHSIGRLDATFDDLDGRFGHPRDAFAHYMAGGFAPKRGPRSGKVQFIDDGGTGAGCTFYLGNRTARLLRVYNKGQQLGDPASLWCRYEIEYRGAEYGLCTDHMRRPGVLLTQYPDLDWLPVDGAGDPAMRVQRETEISSEKLVAWLTVTAGAALTLIADSLGPALTCDLIRNDKTPKRLRRLGDTREALAGMVSVALMDARKHRPIACTSEYLSAAQRWGNGDE